MEDGIVGSYIMFIHRTVAEFLAGGGTWDMDILDVSDERFHARASLSCLWMYMAQLNTHDPTKLGAVIAKSLCYAHSAAQDAPGSLTPILLDFQHVILGDST